MPAWSARGCARALALVLLALAGCASLPPPQDSAAPPAMELAAVPFFPQEDYQCGPAALATLLQAAGIARTPQDLVDHVYLPQRQGSLQPELLGASRRAGALPYVLRSAPEDLLREVAAGHPVLVLQDVGWPLVPRWHYAVVVGYDVGARTLTLRSGTVRRMVMAFDAFDRSWAKGGRWAFVALPPDRLPATAREADFVAAAAALERVAPTAAARAYAEALRAWPGNLFARMALGNAAYRERRLESATSHFRQAATDHPQSGDAWNNLAQALFEQGHTLEAAEAARRAVALGGPRLALYSETLRAIDAQGSGVH
ncbi:PA2778 family cysteine peptidase [Ramlibacter monticola]|uniref:PA2778 family cysteine peptidase n=1 Tax=Ramlibacter monticola TaxID=1926872 RepID=A0A936Z0V7_9BURK|nr:PA2778 family cysteine peptidase [Ramlibacter monticola]MBL0392307.1 PA2778 family cysteine peptidase [Ramlibacter monticola]